MKKQIFLFCILAMLISLSPRAASERFTLDEHAVFYGMDGISFYQGYAPKEQYNTYTLCLPIRAEDGISSITAALTLLDPGQLVFTGTPPSVTVSAQNSIYPVRFSIPLSQNRKNGDYAAVITLTGRTPGGETVTRTVAHTVHIRNGRENSEALRPQLTLNGALPVGETSLLTLTVRNPSANLAMGLGELTLTDASQDILMSGSDRLTLPELLPGAEMEIAIPVTVKANAKVETHSLAFKLTYPVLGQSQVWEEVITAPVTQQIRLELGALTLPATIVQGDVATVTLPLMNLGKANLSNAMASLELPGLISRQSVLVGTIEPGATGTAKLTFSPGKTALGDYTGTLSVTCEDPYGNSFFRQLPVAITVEAASPAVLTDVAQAESPSWMLPALAALSGVLALLMILQGCLFRAKLHRLEEDKL